MYRFVSLNDISVSQLVNPLRIPQLEDSMFAMPTALSETCSSNSESNPVTAKLHKSIGLVPTRPILNKERHIFHLASHKRPQILDF